MPESQVAGPKPWHKKRLSHWCFPVNLVKFLSTSFLQNTSGRILLYSFIRKEMLVEIKFKEVCILKYLFPMVLGQLSPEANCPPTIILTLTLKQTLILTGGNFPRGQLSGHRFRFCLRIFLKGMLKFF